MKASNHRQVSANNINIPPYTNAVGKTVERELHYVSRTKQKNVQCIGKVSF